MDRQVDIEYNPEIDSISDPYELIIYSQIFGENGKYRHAIDFAQKAKVLSKEDPVFRYAALIAEIYPKIRFDFNADLWSEFENITELQQSIEQFLPTMEKSLATFYTYFKATYLNFRGILNYYTSNYLDSIHWLEETLELWNDLKDEFGKIQTYVNFTLTYAKLGKINEAIHYSDLVLNSVDEEIDPTGKCYALLSRADIFGLLADFESSLNYLNQAYNLAIKNSHNQLIATTSRSIAHIYWRRGNFEEVDKIQKEVLEYYLSIDNPHFLALVYNDLGNSRLQERDFTQAKFNFLKSIKYSKKIQFADELIKSYYYLILTDVESEKPSHDLAIYLDQMNEYISQSDNPSNNDYYRISQALLHKYEKRPHKKFKAIELFMNLINDAKVNFDTKVKAIYHLTELLLIEYELSKEGEILNDLDDILDRHFIIATNINSRSLMIDYYLLYSKLLQVLGEQKNALETLEIAKSLAEQAKLDQVVEDCIIEISRIEKEIEIMKDLNQIAYSSKYKFEDIQNYVRELQRGKTPSISNLLHDTPRLIMIISEGGLNLYAEQFATDITSELNLVASFVVAIRNFTQEVFSANSKLEKISLGEDDLLVLQMNKLHFCYMYHGYAPSAVDRLSTFSHKIRTYNSVFDNLMSSTTNQQDKIILKKLTRETFS